MKSKDDVLVTVVTCVYNTPIEYLIEAVSSILNQTYQKLEYYIVDDGSDFDCYSDQVFSDSRITIIKLDDNKGPAAARNIAFSRANGEYIAIMDSDDISLPERIERQVAYMEDNNDVVACGTWFTQFGDKSNEVKRIIDDNEYYRCCLLFDNAPTLLNPSVMLRRSVLEDNNIRYDERLRKGEDYKMWVQLSQIGRITNIHENLFQYRVHNNQTSQKNDINQYGWIVMEEQFHAIGIELSHEEELLMKKDYRSGDVDPLLYRIVLNRVLAANEKSGFFNQDKLKKRVNEQWQQKVYNTQIDDLVRLMRRLSASDNLAIVRMEGERILHKITKDIGK